MIKDHFVIQMTEKLVLKKKIKTTRIWPVPSAGPKIYNCNYRPRKFHGGCYHSDKPSLDSEERILMLLSK